MNSTFRVHESHRFWSRAVKLAVTVVTLAMAVFAGVTHADAAYVSKHPVIVTTPSSSFGSSAGVKGTYALDDTVALDKAGNVWMWGYYSGGQKLTDTGMNGSWTIDGKWQKYGAQVRTGDNSPLNNYHKPDIVRGIGCVKRVAGSAYALMAVDCYGNVYGWGDNDQKGQTFPTNAIIRSQPGYEDTTSYHTGGVYGVYKDRSPWTARPSSATPGPPWLGWVRWPARASLPIPGASTGTGANVRPRTDFVSARGRTLAHAALALIGRPGAMPRSARSQIQKSRWI